MPDRLIVTCEHGGRRVPPRYRPLFAEHEALLATHRGWDPGALQLGREMAAALGAPLYASTTTRLLIDLNRSLGRPTLHSEATRGLSRAERAEIVRRYWRPHRDRVEAAVREAIERGERVLHVASHSFTPVYDGVVREVDVGLLYDPARPGERAFALHWRQALRRLDPALRVRLNVPYQGRGDGLTRLLRRLHGADDYVGIELEVNQRYPMRGGPGWQALRGVVIRSLGAALASAGG